MSLAGLEEEKDPNGLLENTGWDEGASLRYKTDDSIAWSSLSCTHLRELMDGVPRTKVARRKGRTLEQERHTTHFRTCQWYHHSPAITNDRDQSRHCPAS